MNPPLSPREAPSVRFADSVRRAAFRDSFGDERKRSVDRERHGAQCPAPSSPRFRRNPSALLKRHFKTSYRCAHIPQNEVYCSCGQPSLLDGHPESIGYTRCSCLRRKLRNPGDWAFQNQRPHGVALWASMRSLVHSYVDPLASFRDHNYSLIAPPPGPDSQYIDCWFGP